MSVPRGTVRKALWLLADRLAIRRRSGVPGVFGPFIPPEVQPAAERAPAAVGRGVTAPGLGGLASLWSIALTSRTTVIFIKHVELRIDADHLSQLHKVQQGGPATMAAESSNEMLAAAGSCVAVSRAGGRAMRQPRLPNTPAPLPQALPVWRGQPQYREGISLHLFVVVGRHVRIGDPATPVVRGPPPASACRQQSAAMDRGP
jgi:hypothetical protein